MAEFFLNKEAAEPEQYKLHRKECGQLESIGELRYLGSFAMAQAAFNKAKGFYSAVDYCQDCLSQSH